MTKFMRNYCMKIKLDGVLEEITIGDTFDNLKSKTWSYPNLLTLSLDINRKTFAQTNEAHFQIYNLAPNLRQLIFHDRLRYDKIDFIDFYAGYGKQLNLCFRGKILQAYSYKQGMDMITDIEAIDIGFLSYYKDGKTYNYTNLTVKEDATVNDVIKLVAGDMEEGASVGAIGSIGDKTFQTPTSFVGDSISVLDELTGGHVFVDLGKVNVLANKEGIKLGEIPIIKAETGLLGTPMRRDVQLEVDTLFEPFIQVGQLVELQSTTGVTEYNGVFKVIGIHHSGIISATQCGTLTTRFNLYVGALIPVTDNSLSVDGDLTQVEGDKREIVNANTPQECIDVYRYIQKNNKAPHTYIKGTRIYWDTVIKEVATYGKPSLKSITNLYAICGAFYMEVQRKYGNVNIGISSGYRSPTKNASVHGAKGSLHLSGRAIDITYIGKLSAQEIIKFLDNLTWSHLEVIYEYNHYHLGIKESGSSTYGIMRNHQKMQKRKKSTLVRDV